MKEERGLNKLNKSLVKPQIETYKEGHKYTETTLKQGPLKMSG